MTRDNYTGTVPETASDAARIFGERVRAQRLRLGISQETLAELSGLHWTALGKIERGLRNPSLHNIVKIASGLDVDPGTLLAGLAASDVGSAPAKESAAERIRRMRTEGATGA
jgi:transcriptional regulator with XRE-family HTH domain